MKLARIYQRLQRIADVLEGEGPEPVAAPPEEEAPVNVQTDEDYLSWLEGTLIPDLQESGKQATADDFTEGIMIARGISDGSVSQSVAQDYLNYLTATLIPDLQESGAEATASDFQHLAQIISKGGLPVDEEALAEPVVEEEPEPVEPEPMEE